MVFGWRRAFCTSVPREVDSSSAVRATGDDPDHERNGGGGGGGGGGGTPKFGGRFGFFSSSSSNPSTPRLQSQTDLTPRLRCRTTSVNLPEKSASVPVSPKLQCKTTGSHGVFQWSSTPSSPRSPSTFSLLKSNLRLTSNRCGLCLQSVKRGRGVAIYTAECSHGFHFPCIAGHVKQKGSLACPTCGTVWKEMPVLSVNDENQKHHFGEEEETLREKLATTLMIDVVEKKNSKLRKQHSFKPDLKIYDDDEPLPSLTPKARFNPIPETDENCDEDSIEEFQGFHSNSSNSNSPVGVHAKDVDVRLLPETAVISAGRNHETNAIILKVKAPSMPPAKSEGRAPIDVVTVVDVSRKMSTEKIQMMKRTMRLIISSLSSSDRLSIVAFSSYSKRLLPLKRMTTTGQRTARRIVDAMAVLEGSSNGIDAVRKAAKVLEDRREKNAAGSIILISDVPDQSSHVSSTRYSHSQTHLDVALHTVKLAINDDHSFAKSIGNLLNVVVQDLQLDFRFIFGSPPAEITAVYSYTPKPVALGSGRIRIRELFANEERELLIEMKVPTSAMRVHQVLSVSCTYRESVTHEIIHSKENTLVVPLPNPTTLRSSAITIQRLRSLFVTTRAIAESHRLTARNDIIGAYHILISARALIQQTTSASTPTNEFLTSLEAELNDLQRRRVVQAGRATLDTAVEPLTPTSAWRVAEKLAKVAIMRKSLNRVSDLHGFEDARF